MSRERVQQLADVAARTNRQLDAVLEEAGRLIKAAEEINRQLHEQARPLVTSTAAFGDDPELVHHAFARLYNEAELEHRAPAWIVLPAACRSGTKLCETWPIAEVIGNLHGRVLAYIPESKDPPISGE